MNKTDLLNLVRSTSPQPSAPPPAEPPRPISWNGVVFSGPETQDPREVLARLDMSDRRQYKFAQESGLIKAAKEREATEKRTAAQKAARERSVETLKLRAERRKQNADAKAAIETEKARLAEEQDRDRRLGLEPRVVEPPTEPAA